VCPTVFDLWNLSTVVDELLKKIKEGATIQLWR
jgi:hypothetical protein